MIKNILRGKTPEAQSQLDDLFNPIGENPKILWYPSAGNDYRDILELSPERAKTLNINILPDLFIHTDFHPKMVCLHGEIFHDEFTQVRIENYYELELSEDIVYFINPEYVNSPNEAPRLPTIYLFDISITSNYLGELKRKILYFLFENINFLDKIILSNNIKITHLVKVREGCDFGGNRKSISIAYAFLSALGTKYLLIDNEEHSDFAIVDSIRVAHNLELLDYDLNRLSSIEDWSGNNVRIFKVSYLRNQLETERFQQILNLISNH